MELGVIFFLLTAMREPLFLKSKILCFYKEISDTLYFAKVDQDYESLKACRNLYIWILFYLL